MYVKLLQDIQGLLSDYTINIGSLPPDNGLAMYIGAGSPDTTYMDKGTKNEVSLTINAKNKSQVTCMKDLSDIHKILTNKKIYTGDILNIATSTAPNFIGQEDNGQYLYGSILRVDFYKKRSE